MRSALIHDWLVSPIGGSENCLQAIHEIYPSPIYTLLQNRKKLKGSYFEDKEIISSFVQKLPWAEKNYRAYLPFFPYAIEGLDVSSYDLILSSSHCAAKGVLSHSDQLHICYCHTPARYAWDLMREYLRGKRVWNKIAQVFLHSFRSWDVQSSNRVDEFIANSRYVAQRIKKIYRREAHVIYPPVDTAFFQKGKKKENYYVTASRLVPYKRVDLIVKAFSLMPDKRLLVIGSGPEKRVILKNARKNIEFLPDLPKEQLRSALQEAKGFVFAAVEDFGILPLEAMACGTPVIGLNRGGLRETVKPNVTGLFFEEQSVSSIKEALEQFERKEFDPELIRQHAEMFSKERFQMEFREFIEDRYAAFQRSRSCML
ncbi:MAG TPA: glycosyl transferase [Parachlamydiales bacterium]|nr:glycosyl transferase [Parachlamydiales bacterium]